MNCIRQSERIFSSFFSRGLKFGILISVFFFPCLLFSAIEQTIVGKGVCNSIFLFWIVGDKNLSFRSLYFYFYFSFFLDHLELNGVWLCLWFGDEDDNIYLFVLPFLGFWNFRVKNWNYGWGSLRTWQRGMHMKSLLKILPQRRLPMNLLLLTRIS